MPTALFKRWEELTEDEKEAAKVFGYTEASWDNKSGQEVQPNSINRPWDELALKKRNALKALGLTRASWNGRWRGHGRKFVVYASLYDVHARLNVQGYLCVYVQIYV